MKKITSIHLPISFFIYVDINLQKITQIPVSHSFPVSHQTFHIKPFLKPYTKPFTSNLSHKLASNHFSNHIQNLSHKLASNQIQQFCIQFIKPFLKPYTKPNHKTLYPIYKNISQTKYNNIPQTHPYTVILLISRFTHNNSPEGGVPPLRGGVTDKFFQ